MGRSENLKCEKMAKCQLIIMLNINVILKLKNFIHMNRLMIRLIIATLPFLAISCNEIPADNPKSLDYFMKFYGNYHNDNLYDISITQNEEIVLAGYRSVNEDQEEAWIIKTGTNGMVEWEKAYSGLNNHRGYGLLVNENIYFAGYKKTDESTQEGFLCQYSMEGSVIDSVYFNILADEVKDIKFLTNNTNIRFVVHIATDNSDEIHIYEVTAGNDVNLISKNQLYSTIDGSMYYYEQENGDLYLTGSIKEVDNDQYSNIMVSHIVDDNIVWSYSYGEQGETEKSSGIVLLNDMLYVAATEILDPAADEGQVYLMQLNSTGLDEVIINVALTGNNTSYDMLVNGDEEFVFVGERRFDEQNSKVFMARTSLTGDVLSENEYGNKGLCQGRFVVNLPGENKGFIIAGNMSTSGVNTDAKDVIVIKANETGEWIY
jgi:hypothetical protein